MCKLCSMIHACMDTMHCVDANILYYNICINNNNYAILHAVYNLVQINTMSYACMQAT